MKYLLLIYGNQEKWASIPAAEWPEAIARQDAFNRKYRTTGELIGAYGLADEIQARLVRRENGQPAVTDGPYLETKEYIASFYLLDCESEERALQIAADMPFADVDPVEFWPILHEAKPDLVTGSVAAGLGRRAPAPRAGAAGPHRAGAPVRAVPPVRGRQPGGLARGRAAVAVRRASR